MTIHKEGYKLLRRWLIILVVFNVVSFRFIPQLDLLKYFLLGISVLFYLILLQFFRSPSRKTTTGINLITAPADGKVVVIEEVTADEFLEGKRIQISVFMSPVNVHVNRFPVSGKVVYKKYHRGKYLVAWHPKSSAENERNVVVIENNDKVQVLVKQIAGALAKRIICYPRVGHIVKQGEELGFIKFGSRVDVLLPINAQVKVKLNEKVKGGITVLGEV